MTIGVPLPRGAVSDPEILSLEGDYGSVRPLQARALDRWPDGFVRWVLLDFMADVTGGTLSPLVLLAGEQPTARPWSPVLAVSKAADTVEIDTGTSRFSIRHGASFPLSNVVSSGSSSSEPFVMRLQLGHRGQTGYAYVESFEVQCCGPVRAEIALRAKPIAIDLPLEIVGRIEFFAGSSAVRMAVTVRNTRKARHPGGIWELGDAGSVLLDFLSLVLAMPDDATAVRGALEANDRLEPLEMPVEVYQDSSGGEHLRHRTHVNREGVVPTAFRGYRVRSGSHERSGLRASPVIEATTGDSTVTVAVPSFWENFPRAVNVGARTLEIGFHPRQFGDRHELQGGEQKTHVAVVSFDRDDVSNPPLAWCHDPLRIYPSAAYCCATGAVPFLTPVTSDDAYRELAAIALDPARGFIAKRERFDEYGWRHFGDLPADHESAFQPSDRPFVSHYNNQYDAIAAFAVHFLRSGDARWWRLMDDLARHVVDIDIYHTREDKAAYNGGMFWHTQHYTDAGRSTHRTYPNGTDGGGPSAEHNYNVGLMVHYFITGEPMSRESAIGLAEWVASMDDGRLTPFRWLSRSPTGLASATGSMDYHGPGRGPANSILASLVAHRLSGRRSFLEKAEELIRRCIHPSDDIEARNLFDVERRWYYTVFLQALGVYLQHKEDAGELDGMYAYARSSLLHYARWMAEHERPYLERPEVLEFPSETWSAQDLRKAVVLHDAAAYCEGSGRDRLLARGEYFARYALEYLRKAPTRSFTRPMVLLLGHWRCADRSVGPVPPVAPAAALGLHTQPAVPFLPQKRLARRRAGVLAALTFAIALGMVFYVLIW